MEGHLMTIRNHPDILAAADEGHARAAAMVEAGGIAAVLAAHRTHDRRSDPEFPWCICGWVPDRDGNDSDVRVYDAHLAHVAAAIQQVDQAAITTAVATIDALDASDPERAHGALDDVLLEFAPREVRLAAIRLIARCDWWAGA
jgi:hypothetical protein